MGWSLKSTDYHILQSNFHKQPVITEAIVSYHITILTHKVHIRELFSKWTQITF